MWQISTLQGRVKTEDDRVDVRCLFVSHDLEVISKMAVCRHRYCDALLRLYMHASSLWCESHA